MTLKRFKQNQVGAALLEVIVAVGIVTLVMTTIVSLVTVSLKSASIAQSKNLGTKYSQEGLESLRQMRNVMGWDAFLATLRADGTSIRYCLTSVPHNGTEFANLQNAACGSTQFVDQKNLFQRQADITINTVGARTSVAINVRTTWNDSGVTKQSIVAQQFEEYNLDDAVSTVVYSPLPYGYGVSPQPSSSPSQAPSPIPSPSPSSAPVAVGFWRFNEGAGTVAADSSGNNRPGALTGGGITWVPGISGTAINFPASTNYVLISPGMTIDERNFSASAWVKTTSASDIKVLSMSAIDHLLQLSGGKLRSCINGGCFSGTKTVTDGNWHFIGVSGSGTTNTLYVDGVADGTFTSGNTTVTWQPHVGTFPGGGNWYTGAIDDLKIYNGPITAAAIASDYAANAGWKYRKAMVVNNTTGAAQPGYQMPMPIDTASLIAAGKMKPDCSDARITDATLNNIPFWIDEGGPNSCNQTLTRFWTKSTIPNGSTILYIYYGNPNATDVTYTGNDVFDFFDDFSGSTLDTAKWTATGVYSVSGGNLNIYTNSVFTKAPVITGVQSRALEARVKWSLAATGYSGMSMSNASSIQGNNGGLNKVAMLLNTPIAGTPVQGFGATGTVASYNTISGAPQYNAVNGTSYEIGIAYQNSLLYFFKDYAQTGSYATTDTFNPYVILGHFFGSGATVSEITDIAVDFVSLRKFIPGMGNTVPTPEENVTKGGL